MPVEPPLYPVNLVLEGRRCLVVGGGRVAVRKIDGLLACRAEVHVVAPELHEAITGEARAGLTWERRPYRRGEVAGYRLVVTATGAAEVDGAVFADAEGVGVWVNSADDPARCTFTLPAVVRQGPITVAVGTGGRSPALATWLKRRFAAELGPEYLTLLEVLEEVRAARQAEGIETESLDWQAALDSGMLELVRSGRIAEAKERLQACL